MISISSVGFIRLKFEITSSSSAFVKSIISGSPGSLSSPKFGSNSSSSLGSGPKGSSELTTSSSLLPSVKSSSGSSLPPMSSIFVSLSMSSVFISSSSDISIFSLIIALKSSLSESFKTKVAFSSILCFISLMSLRVSSKILLLFFIYYSYFFNMYYFITIFNKYIVKIKKFLFYQ